MQSILFTFMKIYSNNHIRKPAEINFSCLNRSENVGTMIILSIVTSDRSQRSALILLKCLRRSILLQL